MTDPTHGAAAMVDGGDLDCGSGLLLIIREAMQPLASGAVLEVRSREASVGADLPAWCRLVGHDLLRSQRGEGASTSYYVRKKVADDALAADLARARAHTWRVRARAGDGLSARAYARNHALDVGQPASFDTADAAPSAVEVLLAALAACLAAGMRWRAVRRGVEVYELEVSLQARLDDPLAFLGLEGTGHAGLAGVEGRLFIDSDASDEVLDEVWRETLERSPVARTLALPVPLAIERRTHA